MQFGSDNWAGVAPEILDAIAAANHGMAPAYGDDPLTTRVEARFRELFETDCTAYLVATGGAANGLALSVLTPPYGVIVCHSGSHIQTDECCGPEFFTGGAKLLTVAGAHGKLAPEGIEQVLESLPAHPPHSAPLAALSLTQGSECGTLYTADQLATLADLAHGHGMRVHVDGARFANAVAASGASPADLTWRAGVDVLSFGGTKNGCLAAEAVVFFDPALIRDFEFKRKRAGHLWSKMRFIAAQFDAYLADDLWLRLAAHANAMAGRLSRGLAAIDGIEICHPTEINEVFAAIDDATAAALRAAGATFYPWVTPGETDARSVSRLIASFATTAEDVDRFLALAREAA